VPRVPPVVRRRRVRELRLDEVTTDDDESLVWRSRGASRGVEALPPRARRSPRLARASRAGGFRRSGFLSGVALACSTRASAMGCDGRALRADARR
jgi:hypothetical protein